MPDVIGIDHIYLSVSDLAVSERFYDTLLVDVLGFRKNHLRSPASRTSSTPTAISASCSAGSDRHDNWDPPGV
jgi:hypothetical protein